MDEKLSIDDFLIEKWKWNSYLIKYYLIHDV